MFGSDLSPKAVARAESEAARRDLNIRFAVADVRELEGAFGRDFDVVISCDNSLPHLLTDEDLTLALRNIRNLLTDNGLFIASIRDYDRLLLEKPSSMAPILSGAPGEETITFQIWDWSEDSDTYLLRFFIVDQPSGGWRVKEIRTRYRAIRRQELDSALETAGFTWNLVACTGTIRVSSTHCDGAVPTSVNAHVRHRSPEGSGVLSPTAPLPPSKFVERPCITGIPRL